MSRHAAKRVLIAGGGVAALEAALALQALAEERVTVELLAPEPHFWYRPLAVAEPFGLGEARHFSLAELAGAVGATLTLGRLVAVDASRRLARTAAGAALPYDALLVACGGVAEPAVAGALTFRGPADTEKLRTLLGELETGAVRRIAFAIPRGAAWSLPAYELALLTAAHAPRDVEIVLVTPEETPLQLFGPAASEAIGGLLEARGIRIRTDVYPIEHFYGELRLAPDDAIAVDRVVALPRLRGERIDGLPQTCEGFIPVDSHSRVLALADVFAAGDITTFPVKQGGIAAQQADAAAEAIAAAAGAELTPRPFRPILRGLLLTGTRPRFLRHELTGAAGQASVASTEALWWPPAKIVGQYLAPFVGRWAAVDAPPDPDDALAIDVEVDLEAARRLTRPVFSDTEDERTVDEAMTADVLLVAPEDTLGEVAERMRERDVGSALVVDYGKLIGILTSRDLLRAFAGRAHPSEARAREWMTAEPVAASPGTSLAAAIALMTEHGFHHVPVVVEDRPVGVLGLRQAVKRAERQPAVGLGF